MEEINWPDVAMAFVLFLPVIILAGGVILLEYRDTKKEKR